MRYSIIQYAAGGLFQWAKNGFMTNSTRSKAQPGGVKGQEWMAIWMSLLNFLLQSSHLFCTAIPRCNMDLMASQHCITKSSRGLFAISIVESKHEGDWPVWNWLAHVQVA